MKNILSFIMVILISTTTTMAQKESKYEETTFKVSMTCHKCQAKIEKNIPYEKGVTDIAVDLENKEVTVVYATNQTSKEKLIVAFEKLKLTAEVVRSSAVNSSEIAKKE